MNYLEHKSAVERLMTLLKALAIPATLADTDTRDSPLIFVNEAFHKSTGYPASEVIGKNCRFLQGENTDQSDVRYVRESIDKRLSVFCDILNYRKDGKPFANRLILIPISLQKRQYFLGIQRVVEQVSKARLESFTETKIHRQLKRELMGHFVKAYSMLEVRDSVSQDDLLEARVHRSLHSIVRYAESLNPELFS